MSVDINLEMMKQVDDWPRLWQMGEAAARVLISSHRIMAAHR
jgi:hypothetical protein